MTGLWSGSEVPWPVLTSQWKGQHDVTDGDIYHDVMLHDVNVTVVTTPGHDVMLRDVMFAWF